MRRGNVRLAALPRTTAALARGAAVLLCGGARLTRVATAETEADLPGSRTRALPRIRSRAWSPITAPGDRPDDPTDPDLRPSRGAPRAAAGGLCAVAASSHGGPADERGAEIGDADFIETICRSVIAPGTGRRVARHTRLLTSNARIAGRATQKWRRA